MSELHETVPQGQGAYWRELIKVRSLGFLFLIGITVAIANRLFVYEGHSFRDVVIAALLWIVVYPLVGYWRYSRKSR